jgi:2-amino-4-hydroxy-6-hydroxymethyldihydropteridine diphosphokinase
MILIALGANLPGPAGPPLAQCEAALGKLAEAGVAVIARSRWYESTPMPVSDQPRYVNGVVAVRTEQGPATLLETLHAIERSLGRARSVANAARTIDLDLLDYDGLVRDGDEPPILPHPRMTDRGFVLRPLADIMPAWRHPVSGRSVGELLAALPFDPGLRPIAQARPVEPAFRPRRRPV